MGRGKANGKREIGETACCCCCCFLLVAYSGGKTNGQKLDHLFQYVIRNAHAHLDGVILIFWISVGVEKGERGSKVVVVVVVIPHIFFDTV